MWIEFETSETDACGKKLERNFFINTANIAAISRGIYPTGEQTFTVRFSGGNDINVPDHVYYRLLEECGCRPRGLQVRPRIKPGKPFGPF